MPTVRVLLDDTKEIREVEVTGYEVPPHYRRAAARGIGQVPMRPVFSVPGYVITQPEITPPEYDYVAVRP
jgi:hypothetical protein